MKSNAMDETYNKYHNEVYLYALSLCREEALAKDLVSETFFKAFLAPNQPNGPMKYWLFRILKNHYIDLMRKDQEDLTFESHQPFLADESTNHPEKDYIRKERNQRLFKHLMQLEPMIYREVIYFYYYIGVSIKEISVMIERTETNTKTILYRARKKLGKQLKEDSYEF